MLYWVAEIIGFPPDLIENEQRGGLILIPI